MKSFVVICIIGLAFVRTSHSGIIDILDDRCLTDSSCGSTEYCDRDFPNPFGRCKVGLDSDKACLLDRYCASKQCSFFRCKPRVQVRNGPCKISADCPDNQYCDEIPERDDLRQCFDRKCMGRCSKDSMCLSDKCHLFTCVKATNC